MIEVYPNLYIGSDKDVAKWNGPLIHAARDPWFRELDLPSSHLWNDSLTAKILTLNLVDADKVEYIAIPLIERALDFIKEYITQGSVLVHCNEGKSRAPSIGYLYMLKNTEKFSGMTFQESIEEYRKLYEVWMPNRGIALFCTFYYRKIKEG